MKITNSSITMASTHHESSYTHVESVTMEAAASKDLAGAILTLSAEAEGKNHTEIMAEYQKKQQEEAEMNRHENEARSLKQMLERMRTGEKRQLVLPEETDMKLKILRKILASLRGEKVPKEDMKELKSNDTLDLRTAMFRSQSEVSFSMNTSASMAVGTTESGTTWQRVTATSGFSSEFESTTFASQGVVQTQDGRSIGFNIEVSMSREFTTEFNILETENYIKTDPLMINLDTNIGRVSDQKFYFDLDTDGKEEQISFAGQGSGLLALDINGDGTINDGSELFGTKSGDGFKDLAGYDNDGNGWIDENDSVFSRLKVWTKDAEGNDYLIDLKDADVGAIYLRNTDTQFSLKNDENKLNAEIKKTGIYLRESSGVAGTLNHVDMVI
ncbi:MAG: hypothetical protein PHC56_04210 [Herbinix sp.]|nr:hypothetical protein [Herbinix sp.]